MSDLEQVVLGMLAEAPMSGYDIKKAFATSPLGIFSSDSAAMYPALRRLRRLGLAESDVDRSAELRPRSVYRPTPAGMAAHEAWLFQPIDPRRVGRQRGLLLLRFVFMETRASRA